MNRLVTKSLFVRIFVATLVLSFWVVMPRALAASGSLVSWGWDMFGQVSDTPSGTFSAVSAGMDSYHVVALRVDGTLVSWGSDDFGEVSDTPGGTFIAVAGGGGFSVAIRTDGTLVSWGRDDIGQVSNTPSGTFVAVACGQDSTVGLRTDGTLVTWGSDSRGVVSDTPDGIYSAVTGGDASGVAIVAGITVGPITLIQELVILIDGLNLVRGIENSLDSKLNHALQVLHDIGTSNDGAACNSLDAFINETHAQSGKKITAADAATLIAHGNAIKAALGCN